MSLAAKVYKPDFVLSFKTVNNEKLPELKEFLELYHGIENEDKIKPVFSQTSKYKSFPINFIPKKYSKKLLEEAKKGRILLTNEGSWKPYTPLTDIDKMKQIITSTLNKITNKNFAEISEELLNNLMNINCVDALDILAMEILKKAYYDSDYIHLYVTLCSRIWENKKWHKSLITIIKNSDTEYYWCENRLEVQDTISYNGPYNSDGEIMKDVMKQINFKNNLLVMCQKEFKERHIYLEKSRIEEDDEIRYKLRRRVFSLIEFIALMYNSGYISEKTLHVVIADLLQLKDYNDGNEVELNEDEVEAFVILWKLLYKGPRKPFCQKYIDEYIDLVENWIMGMEWQSRIRYLLEDVVVLEKGEKVEEEVVPELDDDELFEELNLLLIDFLKNYDVIECLNKSEKICSDKKRLERTLMECIFNLSTEYLDKHHVLLKLVRKIYNYEVFTSSLYSILESIEDIELDVKGASVNLAKFVGFINEKLDHQILKKAFDGISNIASPKVRDTFVITVITTILQCTRIKDKKVLKISSILRGCRDNISRECYNNLLKSC